MLSTSSGDELQKDVDDLELTVDLDEILSFRRPLAQKKHKDADDTFDDFVNGIPRKGHHDSLFDRTANESTLMGKADEEEFYEMIINNLQESIQRERRMQKELKRMLHE